MTGDVAARVKPQTFVFEFSTASIDALKWLAVSLMVVDHINKFVFKESVPSMFALGRVGEPLFDGRKLILLRACSSVAGRHRHRTLTNLRA